ncbi:MAG: NAD(P)H-hydrate dehydratase [Candidatus Woesearchaeota archaeon]|nr:NAD(P)H-hydrate dehydratase [Candidatus Woesearchaeota archaeon]
MRFLTRKILDIEKRKKNAHKGDYGRVLVVGGSEDYVGAPALAAMASLAVLRSGADVVTVAAPEKTAWAINCISPDLITKKIKCSQCSHFTKDNSVEIVNLAENGDFDAVLIGPGLGRNKETLDFARIVCSKIKKPKVIDADALKAIRIQEVSNAVFTPHIREFEIMLKNSRLSKSNFRKYLGDNVLLLKGPVDTIFSKDDIAYNRTGNPVMAKAGTGDVLAGLCAGFIAQKQGKKSKQDLFSSACIAAYLNGAVGDYLLKKRGRTFIASDLVKNIHEVFR